MPKTPPTTRELTASGPLADDSVQSPSRPSPATHPSHPPSVPPSQPAVAASFVKPNEQDNDGEKASSKPETPSQTKPQARARQTSQPERPLQSKTVPPRPSYSVQSQAVKPKPLLSEPTSVGGNDRSSSDKPKTPTQPAPKGAATSSIPARSVRPKLFAVRPSSPSIKDSSPSDGPAIPAGSLSKPPSAAAPSGRTVPPRPSSPRQSTLRPQAPGASPSRQPSFRPQPAPKGLSVSTRPKPDDERKAVDAAELQQTPFDQHEAGGEPRTDDKKDAIPGQSRPEEYKGPDVSADSAMLVGEPKSASDSSDSSDSSDPSDSSASSAKDGCLSSGKEEPSPDPSDKVQPEPEDSKAQFPPPEPDAKLIDNSALNVSHSDSEQEPKSVADDHEREANPEDSGAEDDRLHEDFFREGAVELDAMDGAEADAASLGSERPAYHGDARSAKEVVARRLKMRRVVAYVLAPAVLIALIGGFKALSSCVGSKGASGASGSSDMVAPTGAND